MEILTLEFFEVLPITNEVLLVEQCEVGAEEAVHSPSILTVVKHLQITMFITKVLMMKSEDIT